MPTFSFSNFSKKTLSFVFTRPRLLLLQTDGLEETVDERSVSSAGRGEEIMMGVGDIVIASLAEDEKEKENTPPPLPEKTTIPMATLTIPTNAKENEEQERAVSVDSDGFEIAGKEGGGMGATSTEAKAKRTREKMEEQRVREQKKLDAQRQRMLEKQKKEEEKKKRMEEKEMRRKEREKELEEKRMKREEEKREKEEKKRREQEEKNRIEEEKRMKREEEKREKEEKKRREQEEKNRIEEQKRMEKERREALKRKQSEKLLGFFKQKSPKKKLKASSLVDVSSSPSKEIVKMLDEELFNKSKALDVDVVQNWKRTLEKFKSARGKQTTKIRHWNARVHMSRKDFDPFRAKSSSPEEDDDDGVEIIGDDGGDVYVVDTSKAAKGHRPIKYKKYYNFASYELNYHERPPWYGYCLPSGRPTLSQTLLRKLARNWRRKCDDVDYDCDSGGEDYEYESEGEDIMDEGDDLEDEDEDLDVEDEEEDGQEFFIPDTRIIRGEFGQDDEEENLDAIRREDSCDVESMGPSTSIYISRSKARRTIQQWVGEAKKQRKTLVVTSLLGSAEDGITRDVDGVVLKGFEINSHTMKGFITCGVDYEEAKKKTEDEAERVKREQKKMKLKEKKATKEETKAQSDAAKNENGTSAEFGKTTFVTQEGLDKLFKTNNSSGAKRVLDSWVKYKDEPAAQSTEVVIPTVPESTDSEIWDSFRKRLLETNATTNTNPLGEYLLWFDSVDVSQIKYAHLHTPLDQPALHVSNAFTVVGKMPTDIAKLIGKLASQAGRPEVARVELIRVMRKIVSITRDNTLHLSTPQITVANNAEMSINKAAPMPVLLEEAATATSIKNIVDDIFSLPATSNALKQEAFALLYECVVKHAELDPARKMWRNDIIRNVCHTRSFLDTTASYFMKSSKGEHWQQAQEQHRQQNAMQMANEITKGSLCDTFCVLRSVEASRLALALCEFVLHTFQDEGGLKNIDFEDINGKEYTLAFRVAPEALSAISNMIASCPNVFKSSKVCEAIEKVGKFVARLSAIFGKSPETEKLTEDALEVLKNAIGFGTDKRAGDCLLKTLGDCGDMMVSLSLFNHPTVQEVKDFVRNRMNDLRTNKAILEEVGIHQ